MNRDPREEDLQDNEEWAPPSHLPAPKPMDGWRFKYVRLSVMGEIDRTNMSKRRREGWEPVNPEEQPELMESSDSSDRIEIGGLVLCKAPEGKMRARDKHFARLAHEQVTGLSTDFRKNAGEDTRAPIMEHRETKTSNSPF